MGRKEVEEIEVEEIWEPIEIVEIDEINMINEIKEITEKNEKIRYFFNIFEDMFDKEIKKEIFLEGVIREYLANKLYPKRSVSPLKMFFDGLNLDEKEIMELLPAMQKELEKNMKSTFKREGRIIKACFDEKGKGWGMTNREIGFYFILGVNFFSFFLRKEKVKER